MEMTQLAETTKFPSGADVCLVNIYPTGPEMGTCYFVQHKPLVLGRDGECDVCINHPSVSRRHANIIPEAKGYEVVDLNSTNGTYVNRARVFQHRMENGDYLQVGNAIFRFLHGKNLEASYHEEIYRMAIIDGLTNTHNRRYLLDFLDCELARTANHNRPLSVILLDIDHFSQLNNELGYQGGEFVLAELASTVFKAVRKNDLLARYGNEEFVVVLPETGMAGAMLLAERLRDMIERHLFVHDGKAPKVTVSGGVATTDGDPPLTPDQLLHNAEEQMLRAKESGRNCIMG